MSMSEQDNSARMNRNKWKAVYDAMVYSIAGPQQRWFEMSNQMASDDNDVWIGAMKGAIQEAVDQRLVEYCHTGIGVAEMDKSIYDMTRKELNHWAGWFGLTTDAERFRTKAELVAAIESANGGVPR